MDKRSSLYGLLVGGKMIFEFVDKFRNIQVGQNIKIFERWIPRIPQSFSDFIKKFGNKFTVREIQKIDYDNAMILVHESDEVLEYYQISPLNTRILNSMR